MDMTSTFLPVAQQLIDATFPTDIIYRRNTGTTYDPATGGVVASTINTPMKAGVLNRSRTEEGGSNESWLLTIWVHHGATGLSAIPTTADEVLYDGLVWKVNKVDPTYSSTGLIASKLVCRSPG